MTKFTIFTPTYNSAAFIHRAYESVRSQTRRDFEWIVIDDCSTDDTVRMLREYQAEADFTMQIVVKDKNSGLLDSYNRCVALASGEFFVGQGHDDRMAADTLQFVDDAWETIPPERRHEFCGIAVRCEDPEGHVAEAFPEDGMDSSFLEMHFLHGRRDEQWFIVRTDVLRQFPFPGHFRVGEGAFVWFPMAERYRARYFNRPLRVYYRDNPSSMTRGNPRRYAAELAETNRILAGYSVKYASTDVLGAILLLARHQRFSRHAGRNLLGAFGQYRGILRVWGVLALPVALAMLARDAVRWPSQS